jgi:hypothetical protein
MLSERQASMKLLAILAMCLVPFSSGAQGTLNINPGPNKRFINFDAMSTGDAVNFGFASTLTPNTDGTYNDVMRWGWNVGDGASWSGRADTFRSAFYYAIEHNWLVGGRYWTEAHQYQITPDGISFRPDSSIYPHDGGAGSGRAFNVDRVTFGTWSGAPVARFTFDTVTNRLGTTTGLITGLGGVPQLGRTLKVYGNAEVTGPLILGSYVQGTYIVLTGPLYADSVRVGNKQVVGKQCPAIPDATSAADVVLQFNDLLDCLRMHGLLAP